MAAVIKEGPCSEHIRLSQVPVLHLSTFYTYSRAAQAGVACRCLLSRIVLLPTGNTRCRKFPFIAEGMAVFGGCLSQKGSPPSRFLSDESSARGARPGISEMAFPDPVVICCKAFQTLDWAAPVSRLWMTQMLFISRCWTSPFHFPGRGKRLIYSLCQGGRGQKQTLKRNNIFSDIFQILRLNACNLPFQDFSPLMSDILICIQLQLECAPFNFLRELWQADMRDAPHSLVTNWLQKAIATVRAHGYGWITASQRGQTACLCLFPCCKLAREILLLLKEW